MLSGSNLATSELLQRHFLKVFDLPKTEFSVSPEQLHVGTAIFRTVALVDTFQQLLLSHPKYIQHMLCFHVKNLLWRICFT